MNQATIGLTLASTREDAMAAFVNLTNAFDKAQKRLVSC
jgi:hypothetical protein